VWCDCDLGNVGTDMKHKEGTCQSAKVEAGFEEGQLQN